MRPFTQNLRPKSNDNRIICPPVSDEQDLLDHDIGAAMDAAADLIATCDKIKKSITAFEAAIDEAIENLRRNP